MAKHVLQYHGWTNDKSYCDYARWWDCSFWCGNNKIFGKNLPTARFCPMNTPTFDTCPLKKDKKGKNGKSGSD